MNMIMNIVPIVYKTMMKHSAKIVFQNDVLNVFLYAMKSNFPLNEDAIIALYLTKTMFKINRR